MACKLFSGALREELAKTKRDLEACGQLHESAGLLAKERGEMVTRVTKDLAFYKTEYKELGERYNTLSASKQIVVVRNGVLEELTLKQTADIARLNNPAPIRPDLGTISAGKVATAYGRLYGVPWVDANNAKITGDTFNRVCIEDVMHFTEWTRVSSIRYTEIVKCGEFALALVGQVPMTDGWRGIPMGYLGVYIPDVGWHAIVTVYALPTRESRTEKIYYIEPQQGTGIPFDKASKWDPGLLLMV